MIFNFFYLYWNEPKETPNICTLSTVGSPKGLGPIPFLLTLGAYIVTYTTKITQTYSVKWLCCLIISKRLHPPDPGDHKSSYKYNLSQYKLRLYNWLDPTYLHTKSRSQTFIAFAEKKLFFLLLFLTSGPACRLAWQARGRKLFSMALMSFMFNLTIGLHSADTIYSWVSSDTINSWGTERHVYVKCILYTPKALLALVCYGVDFCKIMNWKIYHGIMITLQDT